ncbi:MAG: NAD(P)H-dependent oxidoreductase [Verrucomicrobia bacterium]|nr:NAD(P)H-dependent oxidoreductase [Verrucomicrobiota bacterium]
MKKLVVSGASNSRQSINRKWAQYVASQVPGVQSNVLDLNYFEMPIYSVDRENGGGIPDQAGKFLQEIKSSDGVVISMAEHNGSYTAAFKNIFDWVSRLEYRLWSDKPMFLLSTSPGARGASTVFELAKVTFPRLGANITASFSLPSFNENFSPDKGITDPVLNQQFLEQLRLFTQSL